MEICINQIRKLPIDIAVLLNLSQQEGFKFIKKLVDDFNSDQIKFNLNGEALFEVRDITNTLIGIGGITVDSHSSKNNTGRIRRFYIHPTYRRLAVGSLLLKHIEQHAKDFFDQLSLYTDTEKASIFYEKNGFFKDMREKQTHYKILK